MSARHRESYSEASGGPPIVLKESGTYKFDQKTLLGVLALTVAITTGWMSMKSEIKDANKRIDTLEVQLTRMELKLDKILGR